MKFDKAKYIGKKFGKLTIVDTYRRNANVRAICECECGEKIDRALYSITGEKAVLMCPECHVQEHFKDIIHHKIGHLYVTEKHRINEHNSRDFLCICDCGKETWCHASMLMTDNEVARRKSCGCQSCYKYGADKRTLEASPKLLKCRENMIERCCNPNYPKYYNYGGRGISVCKEWLYYPDEFISWGYMSGFEEGLEIDRIDVNGNYEPSNCRWVDEKGQANNKRNTVYVDMANGETMALALYCEQEGLRYKPCYMKYYESEYMGTFHIPEQDLY